MQIHSPKQKEKQAISGPTGGFEVPSSTKSLPKRKIQPENAQNQARGPQIVHFGQKKVGGRPKMGPKSPTNPPKMGTLSKKGGVKSAFKKYTKNNFSCTKKRPQTPIFTGRNACFFEKTGARQKDVIPGRPIKPRAEAKNLVVEPGFAGGVGPKMGLFRIAGQEFLIGARVHPWFPWPPENHIFLPCTTF